MKNRLIALAVAAGIVFAIPVAASATDDGDAPPEPPPIDLEERFDTFDEAVQAVTERMSKALDRLSDRYARAQDWTDAPEELLERLATAIEHVEANLAAVAEAEDFDDLNSILEEAREQRREMRGDRPHRPRRCGPPFRGGDVPEELTG